MAGLGPSPGGVVINGAIDSFNRCFPSTGVTSNCTALDNFWRSLSNLTIRLPGAAEWRTVPAHGRILGGVPGVTRAAGRFNGFTSLTDYCSKPGYSSGGFIADSKFSGRPVLNGSQQQFLVRNSTLDGWSNDVWNQVFSGDVGAPAQNFGSGGQYTTLAASPVTAEAPFLQVNSSGNYSVFVPAVQHDSVGPSWTGRRALGTAIPLQRFFIATPGDSVAMINAALARGQDLILTPGVYHLGQTIEVTRPDTVVIGPRLPHPGASERHRRDAGSQRSRGEAVRDDLRCRAGEFPGPAAGGQPAADRASGPGRPDRGAGRVLPHRRRHEGPGGHQPRGRTVPR